MADWTREARKAAERYGVDPRIFEAQIRQESGGRQGLTSSAGARDIAQFMPPTARQYGVTLGDGRISDDLDGAARLMRDALKRTKGDYRAALSIYNSGRPDGYKRFDETRDYVKKIMGAAGGAPAHTAAPLSSSPPSNSTTTAGPSVAEQRQGVLTNYLSQRGRPGALAALAGGLGDIQAPASPTVPTASRPGATATSTPGRVKIVGPNPGRLKPQLVSFAQKVAGIYGKPLTASDGTGHSYRTATGGVSQHSTGQATDIPASGAQLTAMGRAALIAAGMPRAQAMKQTGGLFNLNGHQIIFHDRKRISGSPHDDHLHISAR